MDEKIEFLTGPDDHGVRLDVYISSHLNLSRSYAVHIIEQGLVLVDGSIKRPSFKLKSSLRIHGAYGMPPRKDDIPAAREMPLEIIYEDQWIVVVNKPAGLTVHPGAGNSENTLVNGLLARYPEMANVGDPSRPGIVHRLDKMTSGVMVVARHADAYSILVNAFKAHEHLREYRALIYGRMSRLQGTIETFMQRNPGNRMKMTSRAYQGKKAITHWKVLKEWEGFSLLELSLLTGRTHQIRVHLSDMGYPVVGDAQYGGRRRAAGIKNTRLQSYIKSLDRQMLHACTLGITHPVTGKFMEFKSRMPREISALISLLDDTAELGASLHSPLNDPMPVE